MFVPLFNGKTNHDLSKMLMVFREIWGLICVLHLVLVSLLRWGIKIMQDLRTDKNNVKAKDGAGCHRL